MPFTRSERRVSMASEFVRAVAAAKDRAIAAAAERKSEWGCDHEVKLTKKEERAFAQLRREHALAEMRRTYEGRGIEPLREWDE